MFKLKFSKYCFYLMIFLGTMQSVYSTESEKIIIDYYPRPPYYMAPNGANHPSDGIIYHLVVKIMVAAKIPYEFNLIPFVRTTKRIKENKIKACAPSSFKTKEREEYAYFSKPIFQDKKNVLIIRKDDERFKKYNISDDVLKDPNLILLLKIGLSYGDYIGNKLLQYKNVVLTELHQDKRKGIEFTSDDNNTMLDDIINKKADYMFIGRNEADYLIDKNKGFKSSLAIKQLKDLPEGEKRYFMCSKVVGLETMKKIDKAILKVVK